MTQLQKSIERLNGEIIGSVYERDSRAFQTVIAYLKGKNEYVVYTYNIERDSLFNGYYTTSQTDAYKQFAKRLQR